MHLAARRHLGSSLPQSISNERGPYDVQVQQRLQKELDTGEAAQETLFLARRNIRPKRYPLHDVAYVPGDLLAVTSKRILWITDRNPTARGHDVYGSIACYAPIGYVRGISLDTRSLLIAFQTGRSWSVPLRSLPSKISA
jgi:hypothetical protein